MISVSSQIQTENDVLSGSNVDLSTPENQSANNNTSFPWWVGLIIGIVILAVIISGIFSYFFCIWKPKQNYRKTDIAETNISTMTYDRMVINPPINSPSPPPNFSETKLNAMLAQHTNMLPQRLQNIEKKYFFKASDIYVHLDKKIGEGKFGSVYIGSVKNNPVAVKVQKMHEIPSFCDEATISHLMIGHENVMGLTGIYWPNHNDDSDLVYPFSNPILFYKLMEKGSVLDLLKKSNFIKTDLALSIIHQTARGLEYLHSESRMKRPVI